MRSPTTSTRSRPPSGGPPPSRTGRPCVILRSHIAYPSPTKTDDPEAHGYALKDDDIRATKEVMGLPPDETFYVPDDVLALYRAAGARGHAQARRMARPPRGLRRRPRRARGLPHRPRAPRLGGQAPRRGRSGESVATRKASGACLEALVDVVPALVAGGADLTGNTGTVLKGHGVQSRDEPGGRQLHFGVREHGMAATMTGMALHGGVLPVGGTFLVFSDYCRGSLRLASLSRARVIYSFTHDSVGRRRGRAHPPADRARRLAPGHPRACG